MINLWKSSSKARKTLKELRECNNYKELNRKLEEIERIEKEINPHFLDFLYDWNYKFYVVVGGYGSSKSYNTGVKLILKLLEEKRTALVVRNVYGTIKDSTFSLLKEILEDMGLGMRVKVVNSPHEIRFPNGSKIIFKGMDNKEKLKSINNVSVVWIEEASEVPYDGFKELIGRLRHPTSSLHMILTTNPVSKSTWLYKHFFIDATDPVNVRTVLDDTKLYRDRVITQDKTYYHHSTCDDNYFLPKDYLDELEDMKNYDPDLYRVARKGHFGITGRKVLPQFEVVSHETLLEEMRRINPRDRIDRVGMDFGFEDSYNAIVRMTVDNATKTLYLHYVYYDRGKTDDITFDEIAGEFLDSQELIIADNAEPKTIQYYRQRGLNMRACRNKYAGSRVQNTKKVKRFKRIVCSDRCPEIAHELQDLTYLLDDLGQVIPDKFSIDPHTFSAIWYGLDGYEVADAKQGLKILKHNNVRDSSERYEDNRNTPHRKKSIFTNNNR